MDTNKEEQQYLDGNKEEQQYLDLIKDILARELGRKVAMVKLRASLVHQCVSL